MENTPMHVLVVATWYPVGWDKLIGIYHKHFCKALAENGFRVNMLHIDRQAISALPRYPFMKKAYCLPQEGYTTYCRRMLNLSRISYDLQMKRYARQLDRLYRAYEKEHGKPDVIHAQVTVPGGYAACVIGKKYGIPVVITEHASYFQRFFRGKEEKYGRFAAENAKKVTFVSSYMAELFTRELGLEAQVLPNIVDCAAFAGPKTVSADDPLALVSVCALRPGKQIPVAVEALKLLRDSGKLEQFHYTVVGDGDQAESYKAAVKDMGMEEFVSFVGAKSREQIAQILSSSHILLIPSQLETFGIPAVEALAAGVPVVSTRCKGPETFLTPECAELCQVNDPADMAQAIYRMYCRLPQLDENALRAAARQFDSAAIAARAGALYREAIEN